MTAQEGDALRAHIVKIRECGNVRLTVAEANFLLSLMALFPEIDNRERVTLVAKLSTVAKENE